MSVADNVRRARDSVGECCLKCGRAPSGVRLMAVSKFFSREAVTEAREAGMDLFGESRVQEALAKFPPQKDRDAKIKLHLIGALQRNKAKHAVSFFDSIDSVDRDELIDTLGELTAGRENPLMILLELNSGEAQKGGYRDENALFNAAERVLRHKGLVLRGLMTVAPLSDDEKTVRTAFRRLAGAQKRLSAEYPGCDFSTLSMGMSGDYRIAIEEGSTLVRIGTAIFGERA